MKTNITLTGLTMLATSVLGSASYAQSFDPARVFVGATMGFQGIKYSGEFKDGATLSAIDLPDDFFTFGIEGGVRIGAHDKIYNNGFTVSVDKTGHDGVETKFTSTRIAKMDSLNLSATFDNYLRLSGDKARRIDLVLGVGTGAMLMHTKYEHAGTMATFGETPDNQSDWSTIAAFKVGMDFELTQSVTLSAMARMFVPLRPHYDVDMAYVFGGAVKYMF